MSVANYFHKFEHDLARSYAIHLKRVIPSVARRLCYGCQVDHPSQKQHDVCLMMTEEERILHCLKAALLEIKEKKVLRLFRRFASLGICLHSFEYIFEVGWRKELWRDKSWCDLVCQKNTFLHFFTFLISLSF